MPPFEPGQHMGNISFRAAVRGDEPDGGLIEAAERSSERRSILAIRATLLLIPLNWLLGTTLPWLYAIALLLLFRARSVSALEALFLGLIGALLLGLVVAMAGGVPADRVVASLFNLSVIVLLIAFLNAGTALFVPDREADRRALYKSASTVFVWYVVCVFAAAVATRATGVYALTGRALILGHLPSLPGILELYAGIHFAEVDWTTAGPVPRIDGFGIYATEGAILLLLLGLLAGIHAIGSGRPWRFLLSEAAILVGLVVMASRTTLMAYLVSTLLLGAAFRRWTAIALLVAVPTLLIGVPAVALYGGDAINGFVAERNQVRLGSSTLRFLSYFTAIDLVRDHNLLTGLGIKPIDDAVPGIPVGSHSTVISMFTKGGLVALLALGAIYTTLLAGIVGAQIGAWRSTARDWSFERRFELVQLSRCVAVLLGWWITEDFDAPASEAVLAGLVLGLFWGNLRQARTRPAASFR